MSGIGSVSIVQVNNMQGSLQDVERVFLFIGEAGISDNDGQILAISPQSDLDTLLGTGDSELKTQLMAAIANCMDENFTCYAIPIDAGTDDWEDVLDAALGPPNDLNIEGVVLTTPATTLAEIEAAQTAMTTMLATYGKFLTCHIALEGIDAGTQTWADYKAATKALINGVAADRVAVVPQLHGNNLGVVIGRLCNPGVTIADTPMRVATGAIVGLGDAPVDSAGLPLTMADIKELAEDRFSMPQWYAGYDGTYWADHPLLDAEGGDFQVYEYRRILDYLARRVRVLAIGRIADRALNSTDASVARNQTYFARPLREAAHAIIIGSREIPGLIHPPSSNDITITWTSKTEVSIAIIAQPYNCPKKITVYLGLDLSA